MGGGPGDLRPPPIGASPPAAPQSCTRPAPRIWRLTPTQLGRTVAAFLPGAPVPLAEIATTQGFGSGAAQGQARGIRNDAARIDMSVPHVETLFATATALAGEAVTRAPQLTACLAKTPWTAACVREWAAAFTERAWRRPADAAELDALATFFAAETALDGQPAALRQLARVVLMSPHFLYRTELGQPGAAGATIPLTAYERASALSYFISDGPPDATLLAAARANRLQTTADVATQARRLLGAPATSQGLVGFFVDHLGSDHVADVTKSKAAFPQWTEAVAGDMARETRTFLEHVLWKDGGRVSTLLTAPYSFVNARLTAVYGMPAGDATTLRQTALPPGRVGLLGHGSFLAAHAGAAETAPVSRGRYVREVLLCQKLPEPPADLMVAAPPPDGTRTTRERLAQHTSDPRCAGCHALMDPVGLAFEGFDAIGRARNEELGKRVDTAGVLTGVDGGDVAIADAAALAAALARAPELADCLAAEAEAYALGRAAQPVSCLERDALAAFRAGGDVRELIVGLVSGDGFLVRTR